MGSPEKPIDLEMGDMSDETKQLNPPVSVDEKPAKEDNEPPRFTGLKKEELLEISSQKKWVVARWILFILFWVGWVGMLVGAIVIVINAPRCKEEPDLPWHQDTVVYEADVVEFGGDLAGVAEHLEYIRSLNARTLSLDGLVTSDDFSKPAATSEAIGNVVESAGEMKLPIKVIARLRIDALSTSSHEFVDSSSCKNGTGNNCDFFIWAASGDNTSNWVEDSTREMWYKADPSNSALAIINYASKAAKNYLAAAVRSWFIGENPVNGLHITDVAKTAMAVDVVSVVKEAMNASDDNPRGLFISSSASSTSDLEALYGAEQEKYAPVMLSDEIGQMELTAGIGKRIRDSIATWRAENGNRTVGYSLNPSSGSGLLIDRYDANTTAAIELLNIALPGIPFLRSGDETGTSNSKFTWGEEQAIEGASKPFQKAVSDTIQARVESYAVNPSLRWDRDDENTVLAFLDVNSVSEDGENPVATDDVLAFTRKWDKKPTMLIVSNLSPFNHTIKLDLESGKVFSSSSTNYKEDSEVDLTKMALHSGTTVVMKL